ncbi:adenosylmethionine--8-amino-7-oxononanoate transaminase [Aurantibacillus circumpalustris]|uniref:adenosylmethionine--8-amino-7-oxononanoate transaminase n=1 Tax=Aurantibacillus circumpalustris TaxID=3036359 RepID=UPI00295A7238|nr:adenosylmethionine--8-amino-7-oxononanoate transaminase [Aurantibacillus circumpalustris]
MTLSERDATVIWHPYTQMKTAQTPIPILRGEGVYLFDENDKKYLDAVSSWWVNLHGHSHPYIAKKVSEQLSILEHAIFAGFTHEPGVSLAERLLKILPGNQSKLFYTDNGSTAVEVALKMAIQYWHNQGKEKNKIIVFEHAYHGDTFGSMSVSARSAFTTAFDSLLFDVISIPLPQKGKEKESVIMFESELKKHKNSIAAFIFEPLILGAGGMLMYEPEVLDSLISACKNEDILCIADEVMTGFGRTGKLFACEYLNEEPDIICLSKGITGGTMALGATSCKQKIYDAFLSDDKLKTLFHGHSYTANPIACAASLASLDLLLSEETKAFINRISKQHADFAKKLSAYSSIENIRYRGTIIAFDIKNKEGVSYFNSVRDEVYNFFLAHGIILRPLGNTIYIMPPYSISVKELEFIYEIIEKRFSN